jgi:hypothetical protein
MTLKKENEMLSKPIQNEAIIEKYALFLENVYIVLLAIMQKIDTNEMLHL